MQLRTGEYTSCILTNPNDPILKIQVESFLIQTFLTIPHLNIWLRIL